MDGSREMTTMMEGEYFLGKVCIEGKFIFHSQPIDFDSKCPNGIRYSDCHKQGLMDIS